MRHTSKLTLLASFLLTTNYASGQNTDNGMSIPLGQFDFVPSVIVGAEYDDNVTRINENKIDSWSSIIAPQFTLNTAVGISELMFSYKLEDKNYFSSQRDSYTDHFFVVQAFLEFNSRHRVTASLDFEDGHDKRGSNFSIGNGGTLLRPDQFKQSEISMEYSYGAFNADGRLQVYGSVKNKDYDIETPIYRARDRQYSELGATFLYKIGALTDMTFDVRRIYTDYKLSLNTLSPLDSFSDSLLVGVKWEATANTSGSAKIGYQTKKFDSALREDFGGIDWEVGVSWSPTDYASLEFKTEADTNETNGEGNFIRARKHSIDWKHAWLERLRSSVGLEYRNQRYEGQLIDGFNIRSDDNLRLNAGINYEFRRWINFELRYIYSERDSNRDFIDYDRNQLLLNAFVTL